MSEKLDSFIAKFNEDVDSRIEKLTAKVEKAQSKIDRASELWTEAQQGLAEETLKSFLEVFPAPTGGAEGNAITGLDPRFISLLDYGDPLEGQARELFKLRNSDKSLEMAEYNLSEVNRYKELGAEEVLNQLQGKLQSLAASTQSLGGSSAGELLESIFRDYEGYEEVVELQLNDFEAPSISSVEAYEALKERKDDMSSSNPEELGSFSPFDEAVETPDESEEETSPINPVERITEGGLEGISEMSSVPPELEKDETESTSQEININLEQLSPIEKALRPTTNVVEEPAVSPDFSSMSVEEIENYYNTGEYKEPASTAPSINEPETDSQVTSPSINEPETTVTGEAEQVVEPSSTTINEENTVNQQVETNNTETQAFPDFSSMSIEEIQNYYSSGNFVGATKGAVSNVINEGSNVVQSVKEMAKETVSNPQEALKEKLENLKSRLSTLKSSNSETNNSETVERTETKMAAPVQNNSVVNNTGSSQSIDNSSDETSSDNTSNSTSITNNTESTSSSDNSTNNQNSTDNSSSSSMSNSQYADNTEMVSRLKKIERLLTGPLEVKIVE